MIALACAGHVLIDLPLFGAPVFLLGGGVWWTTRSERKRAAGGGRGDQLGDSLGVLER